MTTRVNTNGINELDFTLPGTTTATLTSPGITAIVNAGFNSVNSKAASYSAASSDNQKLILFTGASPETLTLPQPGTSSIDLNFVVWVTNNGTGTVTITPTSSTVDGLSTLQLTQFQGVILFNDGTNWFTVRGIGGTGGIVIGFVINSGTTGVNVGPMLVAQKNAQVTKCVAVVKASDPSIALVFKIKQNGTDVFSADPTISAGTSTGTVFTFTSLTSSPLTVTAGDVFSIDITGGSATWQFTAQLES